MGGFRYSVEGDNIKVSVLYTSQEEHDWPDLIDHSKGQFIYYGDNRHPGHDIHDKKGNRVLKAFFDSLHSANFPRSNTPPIFVFQKYPTVNSARSVQFKGLVVPGYKGVAATDDLVAVWKSSKGQRFQNYRAIFTFLNISRIPRSFINSLSEANSDFDENLQPFFGWKDTGNYNPLIAPSTTSIRSKDEQLPSNAHEWEILKVLFQYFQDKPTMFEACAANIFQLHDNKAIIEEITRTVRDGGRDAIGKYILGMTSDPIYAEFSLEAKCYNPGFNNVRGATPVGVKDISRLISRIRNRQFGVLVTTSYIATQAYNEVREDGHPIIFIAGGDIAEILISKGFSKKESVRHWLMTEFSK